MKAKKIDNEKLDYIFSILFGAVTVTVLAFSLLTINDILNDKSVAKIYLFFVFLFLTFSKTIFAFREMILNKSNKISLIKNFCFAGVYLITSVLVLIFFNTDVGFYRILAIIYLTTILANRICLIFEDKKKFKMAYNIVLASLAFIVLATMAIGASAAITESEGVGYLALLLAIVIVVSFAQVIGFAFSKIQLKGLLKIMRHTYVFEILYGLIILMVSFSFFFMITEESIQTFGDGLWYSFAIVTTIGFGDLTVVSTISRILSVILGMYGIVVVATITSVIVNFYNEVKDKPDPAEQKEGENKEETVDNKQEDSDKK